MTMDIPDRIVPESRLWRFKATVLPLKKAEGPYRFRSPLFIYRQGDFQPLGCGVVFLSGHALVAEIALDYSIPERLEVETGRQHWIYPHVTYDLTKNEVKIDYLVISPNATTDVEHDPIGTALL